MPTKPRRTARRNRPLALEPFEPRRMLAFGAELVADVDDRIRFIPTNPDEITAFNGSVIYSASRSGIGTELWRSDGTAAGTMLLKDILPGEFSSKPQHLTNVNGTLFFAAKAKLNGTELFRSDGTAAGTTLVKAIRPGLDDSNPQGLTNVNGTLFFIANDGVHGPELWKSDGTTAGTKLVKDLGPDSQVLRQLTAANGRLFFARYEGVLSPATLWQSDGTAAGTSQLKLGDESTRFVSALGDVNGTFFFVAQNASTGRELWRSDGTDAGTQIVRDINPGTANGIPDYSTNFANVNGTLYFAAVDEFFPAKLWKTDGTEEGTTAIGYSNEQPGFDPGPGHFINGGGTLYFTANNERTLWRSDGTSAGTSLVFDFQSEANSTYTQAISNSQYAGGTLYFSGHGRDGSELWKSDGTAAGTVQVTDIRPGTGYRYNYDYGPYSSYPRDFVGVGGKVVFVARDDRFSENLWSTDGTGAGTHLLDDIGHTTPSADVQQLFNFNGQLLFSAHDADGYGLWTSDATGTRRLSNTGPYSGGIAKNFATIGNTAYFGAAPVTRIGTSAGRELWKTDGTAGGTILVKDINTTVGRSKYPPAYFERGSEPTGFTSINGKVVFAAIEPFAHKLWITDGTTDGTSMLKDVRVGRGFFNPPQFAKLGEHVFFNGDDNQRQTELWRTDGTTAGTQIVKDIHPNDASNNAGPQELLVLGNKLYFTADDGVHGRELWRSDGTATGTVMVRDLVPGAVSSRAANLTIVNGTLFFTTANDDGQMSLWKSDGTAAGTTAIASIGLAKEFVNANGTLCFSSNRAPMTGYELWKSNGTAAGTQLVKDLLPGAVGSRAEKLQGINGVLFFEATLPSGKRGFWISNGTEAGTHQIVPSGTGLTEYQHLTNVNGTLYFAGTDAVHGQELWKLTTAHPQVNFSGTINYKENDPLRLLAPFATVSDADNVRFSGGRLSVIVQQNAMWADRVEIRHQGNESGQIGVSGRWISFGGEVIGSIRDGLPGSQLIIDLNARARVEATQALLRNVGYRNTSDNPGTKPRSVVVTLTDGSGGISAPLSKTINVQAVNDPPRLVLGGQISYRNNSPAILLAPSAVVSDVDSANFLGGMLTVEVTSGRGPSNRLWVSGAFTLQGDRLLRNGVLVGSVVENGFGWNALKLRFNAKMTPPLVQELVRSLRFRTFENSDLGTRILSFTLTDGDGGASATRTKTVHVTN